MQQLSFNFDFWYSNPSDIKLLPEGTYIYLYLNNTENMVINGLYKIIKHHENSVEILFHYHFDKARRTYASTLIDHLRIIKFGEW